MSEAPQIFVAHRLSEEDDEDDEDSKEDEDAADGDGHHCWHGARRLRPRVLPSFYGHREERPAGIVSTSATACTQLPPCLGAPSAADATSTTASRSPSICAALRTPPPSKLEHTTPAADAYCARRPEILKLISNATSCLSLAKRRLPRTPARA